MHFSLPRQKNSKHKFPSLTPYNTETPPPRAGADGKQWQRFQLVQSLSAEELYTQTNLDLGSRQLEGFMWQQQQHPQVSSNT